MAARTLYELLEVGGAEGGDGDGILRPERGLLVAVAVGVPLQIPQARREHERRGHFAGRRRRAEEEEEGFGFGMGNGEWGMGGESDVCFEIESGSREIS